MLLFRQSTMRIILRLTSFSTSVTSYNCKSMAHKPAFLNHKELLAFQLQALRITIKVGFSGTLGGCTGCPLVKSVFLLYCVIKRIVDLVLKLFFIHERVCACGY